jgi:hypothetical protein
MPGNAGAQNSAAEKAGHDDIKQCEILRVCDMKWKKGLPLQRYTDFTVAARADGSLLRSSASQLPPLSCRRSKF